MGEDGTDHNRPMGGLQVVLSGDFFQLPPVQRQSSATAVVAAGTLFAAWNTHQPGTQRTATMTDNSRFSQSVPSQDLSQAPPVPTVSDPSTAILAPPPISRRSEQPPRLPDPTTSTLSSSGPQAGSHPSHSRRFCFQTPAWQRLLHPGVGESFHLQHVHRQSGQGESSMEFISALNAIRQGLLPEDSRRTLQHCVGRVLDSADGILPTQIFTHRKDVDSLNKAKLKELPGELTLDISVCTFQPPSESHPAN